MLNLKNYREMEKMPKARVVSHLEALMKQRNLTVMDIVVNTRISDPTVRRWMKNRISRVDPTTAAKLAAFLECSQEELYEVVLDKE